MIKCKGGFCLLLAFLVLVIPLPWLYSAIFAAAVHELAHYVFILATGNSVFSLELSHRGAVLRTSAMTLVQELLCAAAGPLGSILLVFCYPWFPRIALCAGIQGAFNLLPLGTLDGGRILSCFLHMCFQQSAAQKFSKTIEAVTAAMCVAGVIRVHRSHHLGYGAVFLTLLFLSRCLAEKFLAKKGI